VIKSFADAETRGFWETGRSAKGPPANLRNVARRKLLMLDAAVRLADLDSARQQTASVAWRPRGQHAIRSNDQFRICFAWSDGDACEVEIEDYQ
jgi:proteic killer suppression protein